MTSATKLVDRRSSGSLAAARAHRSTDRLALSAVDRRQRVRYGRFEPLGHRLTMALRVQLQVVVPEPNLSGRAPRARATPEMRSVREAADRFRGNRRKLKRPLEHSFRSGNDRWFGEAKGRRAVRPEIGIVPLDKRVRRHKFPE